YSRPIVLAALPEWRVVVSGRDMSEWNNGWALHLRLLPDDDYRRFGTPLPYALFREWAVSTGLCRSIRLFLPDGEDWAAGPSFRPARYRELVFHLPGVHRQQLRLPDFSVTWAVEGDLPALVRLGKILACQTENGRTLDEDTVTAGLRSQIIDPTKGGILVARN